MAFMVNLDNTRTVLLLPILDLLSIQDYSKVLIGLYRKDISSQLSIDGLNSLACYQDYTSIDISAPGIGI